MSDTQNDTNRTASPQAESRPMTHEDAARAIEGMAKQNAEALDGSAEALLEPGEGTRNGFRTWSPAYPPGQWYFVAKSVSRDNTQTDFFDFGIKDHKGRMIGAAISRQTVDVVQYEGPINGLSSRQPGTYLTVRCQATRNRAIYGAAQDRAFFKTEEQIKAEVERYLKAAKKRAAKTFGQSTSPERSAA